MPFKLGPLEIVLILVIILVVFGVGKLPQVGSALAKSIRAFKDGQSGSDEEAEVEEEEAEEVKKPRRKTKKATAKKKAKTAETKEAA
jgi:sec-independent protein translocase protein TatA